MILTPKAKTTRQNILDAGYSLVLKKGFSALGLQEILKVSGVPKGSFYHYFQSKEAFGCALLQDYVDDYSQQLNHLLSLQAVTARERLMRYWQAWIDDPLARDVIGGWAEDCLVVKLSAEVADLSEPMRAVLSDGVALLLQRISRLITEAREDDSLPPGPAPAALAQVLYQMWLGAALLAKLTRTRIPMEQAMTATERLLACEPPHNPV
ncbi:TetR/AcrR family transcriptional regulator [Brucella sp. TWI559]